MHNAHQTKRIYLTVMGLVAFIALLLGAYLSQFKHTPKSPVAVSNFNGTLLHNPRVIDDFALAGTLDTSFTKANLLGHWTMMFFGFTDCPELCPMTLTELGKMYKKLQTDKVQNLPEVVFISLDPKRDSVDKVKKYVAAFDPHFVGAVGNLTEVSHLAKQMGIVSMTVTNGTDPNNYTIQHSGTIVLLNPQGDIAAYFSMPHVAITMAQDYEKLVS